ncbi:hypothetical protein C7974DRAFT_406540, partial [Boeremia exigua]|uniref:uncharacterized protein n=1 Tax=Boeremia exigua TaxID=749465 RepID=UPI001E8D55F4
MSLAQGFVVSFSSGCGFSVVLGPSLHGTLMKPLDQSQRNVFLHLSLFFQSVSAPYSSFCFTSQDLRRRNVCAGLPSREQIHSDM